MKNKQKMLGLVSILVAAGTLVGSSTFAAHKLSEIYLTLIGGELTIGTMDTEGENASLDLGTLQVQATEQSKEGSFSKPFWVSDLKGATNRWYTTLSASDAVHATDPSVTIPNTAISIKAPTTVTKLAGNENPAVRLDSAWGNYRALNNPLTFLDKAVNAGGILGKYGAAPSIKITIPAYQRMGKYTSTLTYTLMEQ